MKGILGTEEIIFIYLIIYINNERKRGHALDRELEEYIKKLGKKKGEEK